MQVAAGPYPTLITQPSTGRTVPVVQAYCYTKYIGHLELLLDGAGELVQVSSATAPPLSCTVV